MSKNSQNTDKNVEKPSKYRPKCRKTVKPVEKSLITAKKVEKAKKGSKLAKYRRKCWKNEKILTKK